MSYSYTPEKSHVLIRDYKVLRNVICNKEHGREGGMDGRNEGRRKEKHLVAYVIPLIS